MRKQISSRFQRPLNNTYILSVPFVPKKRYLKMGNTDFQVEIGACTQEHSTDELTVRDVIGKTIVIHSNPDDFHTQPAGNAGKKNACGVIRKN